MTIGDKKYISFELDRSDRSQELRNLDFYLGNRLISNQIVYIPTYILSLERFLELLTQGGFLNVRMENLTPEQRFEKIMKERESNEPQFFTHLFQLDETIDPYTIFVFQSSESVDFVWTCWDEHNCNSQHERDQIYTIRIPTPELTSTLKTLTIELKK